jgi:uncharacterized protein
MKAISIICLGVRDLDTSSRFYEKIGFTKSGKSTSSITWYTTGGTVLTLYPWASLAQDVGVPETGSGFRGVTLALNVQSRELVNELIESVRRSGGKIVKEPAPVFWGGYSSYFSDPDGHLWEVAWNPFTVVDEVGKLAVEK